MADKVKGFVEKIVYRNADNAYTVLSLAEGDEETTLVGYFSSISEGEYIEAEGSFTAHSVYGEQFKVSRYEVKEPEDALAMEKYLGSGAIKGIGVSLAARIVKKFGDDTFRIIEEEPERLAEIKGISERKAREISAQFEEKREMRRAAIFLARYGISNAYGVKIYARYGEGMYEVLKTNPYRLADDIRGIGFKLADEIAGKMGIDPASEFRIKAGLVYVLQIAAGNGHTFLPYEELLKEAGELLSCEVAEAERLIKELILERRITRKEIDGIDAVYLISFYHMELNVARMLKDLNQSYKIAESKIKAKIKGIEEEIGITLDDMQKTALTEAARSGVLVVTGGPGTGKTTTINAIIRFFESEQMEMLLAAPTGRAAKRMKETTGYEAQTIHRLLEVSGNPEGEDVKSEFNRNELNPLEADVIIIDEMSMVDISLMHALLKAIPVGTRLILVGDVNQLPSVGPGNVLRDIIASHTFNVVSLTKIFRQAMDSDIIVNAHKIHAGEQIALDNKSKDFFMLKRDDVTMILRVILSLVMEKMPSYVDAGPLDVQVLTPMRKGELGVERLNKFLQTYLNPPEDFKKERLFGETIFREGDKVMQIKNNYQIEWEVKGKGGYTIDSGTGVFNGDVGIIKFINEFAEFMEIEFDDGRVVEYPFSGLDELELAYAITIHKSQGSEYPAVVLPLLTGPRMLFNRNLLYTAVTRAKKCVTIVGSEKTVESMIANENEMKRYSGLKVAINEV